MVPPPPVVDDFTRECVTLIPDTSLSGRRVARELDAAIGERGRLRDAGRTGETLIGHEPAMSERGGKFWLRLVQKRGQAQLQNGLSL